MNETRCSCGQNLVSNIVSKSVQVSKSEKHDHKFQGSPTGLCDLCAQEFKFTWEQEGFKVVVTKITENLYNPTGQIGLMEHSFNRMKNKGSEKDKKKGDK